MPRDDTIRFEWRIPFAFDGRLYVWRITHAD